MSLVNDKSKDMVVRNHELEYVQSLLNILKGCPPKPDSANTLQVCNYAGFYKIKNPGGTCRFADRGILNQGFVKL